MSEPERATTGRRLPDGARWHGENAAQPGDYWRVRVDGEWTWRCMTPNGLTGLLRQHEVTEHEDGTITVSPSILVCWPNRSKPMRYHGFLREGVWETLPDSDPLPGPSDE